MTTDDDMVFDSRYALYGYARAEAADALIDEFIATLTTEDLDGIHNAVSDEAWALVDRCSTWCVARGIDINALGFSDTASRECFLDAAFERNAEAPLTAIEVAETLINGNISTAREAIVLNHTPHEVAVFTIDVVLALAELSGEADDGGAFAEALGRVRRCVNRG
jgi:hypothetical protein